MRRSEYRAIRIQLRKYCIRVGIVRDLEYRVAAVNDEHGLPAVGEPALYLYAAGGAASAIAGISSSAMPAHVFIR
ncbi:hypothetical protein [uncultured Stenotrophomonas sp.]|uniref:hypothetical protein n=1 Tax=uncultured Stenotrophomonas sp. TaxID=165438 RepID=UPI0025E02054|nr:hypothetical protein [uncultured Stenotrophomonas sp.]